MCFTIFSLDKYNGNGNWTFEYPFFFFLQECGNNNWGDWRPHLAMVLCNEDKFNMKKEIITKTAATLGKITNCHYQLITNYHHNQLVIEFMFFRTC